MLQSFLNVSLKTSGPKKHLEAWAVVKHQADKVGDWLVAVRFELALHYQVVATISQLLLISALSST